jgi:hypothetical protein
MKRRERLIFMIWVPGVVYLRFRNPDHEREALAQAGWRADNGQQNPILIWLSRAVCGLMSPPRPPIHGG